MERTIRVYEMPGRGEFEVTVQTGLTVADLVSAVDLYGAFITVDNVPVPPELWAQTVLDNVSDVWAVKGAKGA